VKLITGSSNFVPYDKVWIANDAPAPVFVTKQDVTMGNLIVPAGKYSLYFLPSRGGWKLIVNKKTGQLASEYDESQNLGSVGMTPAPAPDSPVERFAIKFVGTLGKSCSGRCDPKNGPYIPASELGVPQIHFMWGYTDVYAVIRARLGADGDQEARSAH
jgi:Protein of unknown function (DUF2911)